MAQPPPAEQRKASIRASREVLWHLSCPQCQYYWTYATMNPAESLHGTALHCPLCGVKSPIELVESP